ncbi:FliH/SctL family protein [Nocardioides sp. R-C-SC26]|uniref:FliH/SctL family protein n=1 Tax=Nocardioides sp. R-C-SC26 TaxID=2870414 RepID=UPI001E303494|nr:FliH/SctL family protein [Nocardioides sp. R-C-SC26]
MTSSSDLAVTLTARNRVLRGDLVASGQAGTVGALATPELRDGTWTRFEDDGVLGDAVTEQVLAGLAENTRRAAQAQGYAVGWAQGRREAAATAAAERAELEAQVAAAEHRREAELNDALAALRQAAAGLQTAVGDYAADLDAHALRLARELVEAILGRALADGESDGSAGADVLQRVRAALTTVSSGVTATVRLHPALADDRAIRSALSETAASPGDIRVVGDDSLALTDAVVETDEQLIDLAIGTALDRVRTALT